MLLVRESATPGTHVLIVGVGRYPYLCGGTGTLFSGHEGMGQLTSPPVSARAMATWFLTTYYNPDRPLASLDLLISDSSGDWFDPPAGPRIDVEPATFDNVKSAVLEWKRRGDSSAANLMVFYFCGHGMASGLQTTLVAEDFGHDRDLALTRAIDLNGLHLGMDKCAARDQCYFIDACRRATGELLRSAASFGDPIIPGERIHAQVTRNAPIFQAAVPGTEAYGRNGRTSFYTEALLKAMEGSGCDDSDGPWTVQTDVLHTSLIHLLRRGVAGTPAAGQLNSVDHLTRVALHRLAGKPVVPVDVECDPDTWNAHAVLGWRGDQGEQHRDPPESCRWAIELEEGLYAFTAEARAPEQGSGIRNDHVSPPYRLIRIGVTR